MTKCVNENCDYFKEHGECSSVCENNGFTKIFTNYDRIRNMSVEELARFLEAIQENALFNNKIMWENEWEKVLESEVEGE